MKTIKLIAVAFAALAAVSCVKDNMSGADSKTYQASFTDRLPDAKATISVGQEESLVSWETSDRVGIMYGASNLEYKADQAGSHSTLSAVSASADASEVWALLPYDPSATLSAGVINTILPSEQPAKADASFHHLAVAHSTSANLAFSNVCGLVRVKVTTEGITKVVFAGKAQEKVAGNIAITVADCIVSGADAESVALVPAEGAASIAVGDYFLAVLPQTFESGFTVTAYKGETAVQTKDIAGQVTLERCGIIAGTIREVTISAISTNIATVGETVKITGTGFSEVATDNTVSIGNIACTVTAASATELSVTIPEGLSKQTDYRFSLTVKGAATVDSPLFRYYYLPQYTVSTWLGAGGQKALTEGKGSNARLDNPYGVYVSGDYLWLNCAATTNAALCRVALADADMKVLLKSDVLGTSKYPYGVTVHDGAAHVTLKGGASVVAYDITAGTTSTYAASSNPMDVRILSNGDRYIAARDGSCLDYWKAGETSKTTISMGFNPISLAVDSDEEYMYIGAYSNRKLYRMKISDRSIEHIAGTGTAPDKPVSGATSYPAWNSGKPLEVTVGDISGVYCDTDDYIYFCDNHSTRVQVLIPGVGNDPKTGLLRTFNCTAVPGTFGTQGGITKDANGNFYVASKTGHKIVKLTPKQ